jgi:glycosyltransferase involved in cell wall biosynthesis
MGQPATNTTVMKIVHLGLTVNGRGEGLSAAFKKAASEYLEYRVDADLLEHLKRLPWVPDIIFMQIQSDRIGDLDTPEALNSQLAHYRNQGCLVINWTGDIRDHIPGWMLRMSADYTCFSNERDVLQIAKPSAYLQIGIDPEVFKTHDTSEDVPAWDVVFMGNDYRNMFPLGAFRRSVVDYVKKRPNSAVYGNYSGAVELLAPDPNNPGPVQRKESQIYNRCKIALSVSHFQIDRYTSDRLLRAMGSGAFVLAHHYPGIEKDFKPGIHLDTFKSFSEMDAKIAHYLENKEQREQIAIEGQKRVHKFFTYDNMVQNIIRMK